MAIFDGPEVFMYIHLGGFASNAARRREKCVLQPPLLLQQSNLFVQRLGLLLPTHALLKVAAVMRGRHAQR